MYYLPFHPCENINFYFVIALYRIAKHDPKAKRKNLVQFKNFSDLSEQLKQSGFAVSSKTISAYLRKPEYQKFFAIGDNVLILNNDFSKAKEKNQKAKEQNKEPLRFITITDKEAETLLKQYGKPQDKMFVKVFMYLKYYCKMSDIVDDTQEQILGSIGYSAKSGENCRVLSNVVAVLRDLGLIEYETKQDNRGYYRNYYRVSSAIG